MDASIRPTVTRAQLDRVWDQIIADAAVADEAAGVRDIPRRLGLLVEESALDRAVDLAMAAQSSRTGDPLLIAATTLGIRVVDTPPQ